MCLNLVNSIAKINLLLAAQLKEEAEDIKNGVEAFK